MVELGMSKLGDKHLRNRGRGLFAAVRLPQYDATNGVVQAVVICGVNGICQ
jgi:hypothetical protein